MSSSVQFVRIPIGSYGQPTLICNTEFRMEILTTFDSGEQMLAEGLILALNQHGQIPQQLKEVNDIVHANQLNRKGNGDYEDFPTNFPPDCLLRTEAFAPAITLFLTSANLPRDFLKVFQITRKTINDTVCFSVTFITHDASNKMEVALDELMGPFKRPEARVSNVI